MTYQLTDYLHKSIPQLFDMIDQSKTGQEVDPGFYQPGMVVQPIQFLPSQVPQGTLQGVAAIAGEQPGIATQNPIGYIQPQIVAPTTPVSPTTSGITPELLAQAIERRGGMPQEVKGIGGYNAQGAMGGMDKRIGGETGQKGPMSEAAPDLAQIRQYARRAL